MKHVAIVNPEFAPSSLPPALRVRLFARHLPAFGWKPTVVTVHPSYYEQATDAENERLLGPDLDVRRTKALPARWTRRVGFGDLGGRALWHQWWQLRSLAARERLDAVLVPVPPFLTMLLGRLLRQSHGVPYVVDYSDPWVTDDWRRQPVDQRLPKRAWADRVARLVEPFALRRVARIVGVSSGTVAMVAARYPWLSDRVGGEIPFGGEREDFRWIRDHPREQRVFRPGGGMFHVTAASALTPPMYPVVRAIFQAVSLGLSRLPELFGRLRVHFVGTSYVGAGTMQALPLARRFGLDQVVDEHPARVPYLTSLQLLLDSDALLAIGMVLPHYTASKVYSYLLAERPILAVLHEESSAAAVLRELGTARLVTFGRASEPEQEVERIFGALADLLREGPGRTVPLGEDAFEPHSARAMTRRLAQVLDEIAGS